MTDTDPVVSPRRALVAWAAGVAVLAVSLAPLTTPAPVPAPGIDKLAHAVMYAALLVLFARAYRRHRWPAIAAGLTAYGGLIEVLQHFAPLRYASWGDALANAAGVSIMLAALMTKRRRPRGPASPRSGAR